MRKNIRDTFLNFSADTIISFCETALTVPFKDKEAEYFIDQFFLRNQSRGQMYIRALLVKAQLISIDGHKRLLKGEQMIENLNLALEEVKKALEIISQSATNKQKYAFLIYNTSICVYNIIRHMVKKDWVHNFIEFAEKLDKLFEEVKEQDFLWKTRFSWVYFQCLYDDAAKKADAYKVLDTLWTTISNRQKDIKLEEDTEANREFIKFQDYLFRLRIHIGKENPKYLADVKKDADQQIDLRGWKLLLTLQMIKSQLIPDAQIEKELINVINSMSSAILPGNEVTQSHKLSAVDQERLAEAGRIALQHNLINIADSITNFLNKVKLDQKPFIMHQYNLAELLIKKVLARFSLARVSSRLSPRLSPRVSSRLAQRVYSRI